MKISIYAPMLMSVLKARQHSILHPERIVGRLLTWGFLPVCPSLGMVRKEANDESPCLPVFVLSRSGPPSQYRRRPKSNRPFVRKPVTRCGEKPPAQHHSVLR